MSYARILRRILVALADERRFPLFLEFANGPLSDDYMYKKFGIEGNGREKRNKLERYIKPLRDAGLIHHNKMSNRYEITQMGRNLCYSLGLRGLLNILEYKEFFDKVHLERIPREFVQDIIICLNECKSIEERIIEQQAIAMVQEMRKYSVGVTDKIFPGVIDEMLKRLKTFDLEIKLVVEDAHLRALRETNPKAYERIRTLKDSHNADIKVASASAIYMGVLSIDGERGGFIFPKDNERLSWEMGFYSEKREPVKWAEKVFEDISGKAKTWTGN